MFARLYRFLHAAWARAMVGATILTAGSLLSLGQPMTIFAQSTPLGAGSAKPGRLRAASGTAELAGTEPAGPAGEAEPRRREPCAIKRRHLRCPDLIMSAPRELHLDRSTLPGHVLLRATSSVNNHGRGPLELRAHRTGRRNTVVYQVIRDRRGRPHLFRTAAQLVFKYIPGERYEYGNVGAASYWKLKHAAAFELWSVNANGRATRLVRRGPKVDYCLRDLVRTRPSARSPEAAVYQGCSEDPYMRHDILGTSVGWSDVYPYEYPEQWIDVTGLRGRFAYVQIADPDNLLMEASNRNNVSETYITLPSGQAYGTRVGVSMP